MHIDRKLNLVIPVERDTGKVYVHSTPISREAFDRYFMVLATAYAEIVGGPLRAVGNRVAMKMVKKVAADMDILQDVEGGVIAEIRRLSNVVQPGAAGWETVPFQDALSRKLFDPEEAEEIENNIGFFMLLSHMTPRASRAAMLDGLAKAWGVQISSSDCTVLAASLATSTVTASTGPKAPQSPIAY